MHSDTWLNVVTIYNKNSAKVKIVVIFSLCSNSYQGFILDFFVSGGKS